MAVRTRSGDGAWLEIQVQRSFLNSDTAAVKPHSHRGGTDTEMIRSLSAKAENAFDLARFTRTIIQKERRVKAPGCAEV
ncbi:hypothetical protein N7463_006762 [Penicillium fimorum]|uniref:Uncharacterized protein n=1 Tax=Penicillium fimorum TaxID=1882269 RepID=A0A9W9XV23_9EURO|nr:hypothetical protein N7463_006762 [Penicillium fimorum]